MDVVLVIDPSAADEKLIFDGLDDFNLAAAPRPAEEQRFAVLIKRPGSGETIGGLTGKQMFDWLYINLFHIPEVLRGQGLGRAVLQRAESFARERCLVGVWLDTFEFQARGFYEKQGYALFGQLDDFPRGSTRYYLRKYL